MTELADACRANQMTDLIVVHEHRGVPDALMLSHFPHGPTVLFTLTGVVLRHSLGGLEGTTISEAYPQCVSLRSGSYRRGEGLPICCTPTVSSSKALAPSSVTESATSSSSSSPYQSPSPPATEKASSFN
jgi:hypothetical protein